MTRAERELLIERYLNGEMSSGQEQDFFIQVAVDKELRQELKAYRTVDSAIRKDREAERSEHTALRSRVASMLPLYPAQGDHSPAPSAPPAAAGASGIAGSGFGSGTIRWIAATGVAAMLAVGAYLMIDTGSNPDAVAPAPTPALHQAPAVPSPEAPSQAATSQAVSSPAAGSAAQENGPSPHGAVRDIATPRTDAERSAPRSTSGRSTPPARPADEAVEQTVTAPSDRDDAQAQAPAIVPKRNRQRSDTANVGIRIQFPKH
jgi:negative regulator of sigma E activity